MNDECSPTISVVMSVYNEKIEWLGASIDSILGQSYIDFEFIIINDNPQRIENKQVLEAYSQNDRRIIIIQNKVNIGLTKSLNEGLYIAKGKYIARMDADDISMPDRFRKQFDYMESHKECVVCGSRVSFIGRNLKDDISLLDLDIKGNMLFRSELRHPSVLIRKAVLVDNSIKYNEDYRYSQDYELWYQLQDYGTFFNFEKPLLSYRISKAQISSNKKNEQINYGDQVRRLFIKKWLKNNNEAYYPNYIGYFEINKYILFLDNKKDDLSYKKGFWKSLCLSVSKNKLKVFLRLLFTKQTLLLDRKSIVKLCLILIGLRSSHEW